MKHHSNIRKLGRTADQRKALIKSLARSLVKKGRIKTTEAKAKELRPFAERMVTYGKKGTLSDVRKLTSELGRDASKIVVSDLAPRFETRNGGYTRIIKCGTRPGDASSMAYIEFLEE